MLKALTIENYALIDALEISFDTGFSTITGETGAGKSILLGALALLLGSRVDSTVLRDKEKKCVVEAVFDLSAYDLRGLFAELDLEYETETTLRRIINPNGKSRAFVNDAPVSAQQLKDLGPRLVDIHSQHQNLLLHDDKFQLMVVDTLAQHAPLLQQYAAAYQEYRSLSKRLSDLQQRADQSKEEIEYIRYQHNELEAAELQEDELPLLEQELEVLSHAEEIKSKLYRTAQLLNGEQASVLRHLQESLQAMRQLESYWPKATEYAQRIENDYYDLRDIAEEAESQAETVEHDPQRIEAVNQRLALYFQLQKKHRCANPEELIALRDRFAAQLSEMENYDEVLLACQQELQQAQQKAERLAADMSLNRRKAIAPLEKTLKQQLALLGMPNATLKAELTPTEKLLPQGADVLRFLFSANKQGDLQEIARVASGGEISRVMLTLKALLSTKLALPTIIFDEIDTGVSGDIADRMGQIMQSMAHNMQVLSITHLPQVAAKGASQYKVFKTDTRTSTHTKIKRLSADERREEIAKMLSGSQLTQAALSNAEELLRSAKLL